MSVNNLPQATPNGKIPPLGDSTPDHEFLTRQIVPYLFRELRQALTRLSTFDSEEAYQATLNINIELIDLAVILKGGE